LIKSRLRPIWFLPVLIAAACRPASSPTTALDTPYPVVDDLGNAREYRVFLPEATAGKMLPMLVYFHGVMSPEFKTMPSLKGYTGSPVEETGLIPFCREHRIVLLVPKALYGYTFLNRPSTGWLTEKELDGVEKIIDAVAGHGGIDRKRIYLAGISAGAVFGHFLANHRPDAYAGLISHSQAYVSPGGEVLKPAVPGPRFGVVFGYNIGDYKNLIRFCIESERVYREAGYRTALLPDLPPFGHAWSSSTNERFWKWLLRLESKG
jgi:pimeloyl-ACP methyl ester carboxylesterase